MSFFFLGNCNHQYCSNIRTKKYPSTGISYLPILSAKPIYYYGMLERLIFNSRENLNQLP